MPRVGSNGLAGARPEGGSGRSLLEIIPGFAGSEVFARFEGCMVDRVSDREDLRREEGVLGTTGDLALSLETTRAAGIPYVYSLEGDVEDVSRQHIANRASAVVHPAPWYVGLRRPGYFLEQKNGLATEIVTAGLDGTAVPGVPVEVTLTLTNQSRLALPWLQFHESVPPEMRLLSLIHI